MTDPDDQAAPIDFEESAYQRDISSSSYGAASRRKRSSAPLASDLRRSHHDQRKANP